MIAYYKQQANTTKSCKMLKHFNLAVENVKCKHPGIMDSYYNLLTKTVCITYQTKFIFLYLFLQGRQQILNTQMKYKTKYVKILFKTPGNKQFQKMDGWMEYHSR